MKVGNSVRRQYLAFPVLVAAVALALGACSGSTTPSTNASASPDASSPSEPTWLPAECTAKKPTGEMPTACGKVGEIPAIAFPGSAAPTDLRVEVMQKGTGEKVAADSLVKVNYRGQLWDGDIFDSSWDTGAPALFLLSALIPGWQEAIPGTPVGSRILMSVPSDKGYNDGETRVFVLDILDTLDPEVAGQSDAETEAEPPEGVEIDGALGSPATVKLNSEYSGPNNLTLTVLARGTGAELKDGTFYVQYSTATPTGETHSTWEEDSAQATNTSQFDKMVGVPVGSRVLLEYPESEEGSQMVILMDVIAQY